jgi:hypothetical protein
MSIFVAPAIILDSDEATSLAYPAVLWRNLVTAAGITADAEDASYPASNLANPQTSSVWKSGSTMDQDIVFSLSSDDTIDCVGIARHNLGSGAVGLTISGITAEPGAEYETLAELSPGDDSDIMAVVEAGYYASIKLHLEPDAVEPQAAVIYVGKLLRMNKGLAPGFAPPADALQTTMLSGFAENGDFLGDLIVSQRRSSSFKFRPQAGEWYRTTVRPFLEARTPFFFAWSPLAHPDEASFAKFAGDPQAVLSGYRDYFDVSFNMIGLAL